MKGIGKSVDEGVKKFGGFNKRLLGIGLGMTFIMWGVRSQLQRIGRSMFTIFEQATGATGALNEKFNIIRANLGAISIAFFDAFAQSGLFDFLINAVTSLANWFVDLDDSTREWIAGGVIGLVGLMTAISFLGQLLLAIYVAIQLNIAIWGPWAIVGIAAILLLWKVYKSWKEGFQAMNKEIEKTNEITWINWKLKALHNILSVVKFIASLPRKVQNIFFGGIIETSIAEQAIEAGQERLKELNTAKIENLMKTSGYADAFMRQAYSASIYGKVPTATTTQTTTIPNFDPEIKALMAQSNEYQSNQSQTLDDLKTIFSTKFTPATLS